MFLTWRLYYLDRHLSIFKLKLNQGPENRQVIRLIISSSFFSSGLEVVANLFNFLKLNPGFTPGGVIFYGLLPLSASLSSALNSFFLLLALASSRLPAEMTPSA